MSQRITSTKDLYTKAVILQKAFLKNDDSVRLEAVIVEGVIARYVVYSSEGVFYDGDSLADAVCCFNIFADD